MSMQCSTEVRPMKNRVTRKFEGESRTEQNHAEACEINNIVRKYHKTGAIEHRNENQGEYGFVDSITLQECMYVTAKAASMFEEVPSNIRKKFNNKPEAFFEYVQNPNNREELVKLGLAKNVDDIASLTEQKNPANVQYVDKTNKKQPAEKVEKKSESNTAA